MLKLFFFLVSFLPLSLKAAETSCPPSPNLQDCIKKALAYEIDCKQEYAEYLHDKDNFHDRVYPFQMLQSGCHERYLKNYQSCKETCAL